jgi:hypothetical protein
MIYMKAFKKTTGITLPGATLALASSGALAHTGHSHAQYDTLSGILHSLTTHPLLFGIVGLAVVTVAYMSRN